MEGYAVSINPVAQKEPFGEYNQYSPTTTRRPDRSMSENEPAGQSSSGSETVEVPQEEYDRLKAEHERLKEESKELAAEYQRLREEFLAEMREDARQKRVGGDNK